MKTMEEDKDLVKRSNHFANLNNMRLSGKMCDVTIKVNGREFHAHKNILASSFKYFELMFSNNFQENKQNVITIQDVKEEYLEAFISFAYTGEMLLTEANMFGLLELANYLNEDFIKEACINFLVKNLKKENACQAYKLANAIECNSLKNLSRSIILSNFEYCSQTAEYLDLDCESIKGVLCSTDLASSAKQKQIFEDVVHWIMHDWKNRRTYLDHLLEFLQVIDWNTDFLFMELCNFSEYSDYDDIVKDIMAFYRQKNEDMRQSTNLKKCLVIIGNSNEKLQVQFSDFTMTKWYPPLKILDCKKSEFLNNWTILNNKIYYTFSNGFGDVNLQVFDPAKRENTMLSNDNRLLRNCSLCACSRYLYLFGGQQNDKTSDKVLRYDPLTNSFETLPSMSIVRNNAAAIFYQGRLLILGGEDFNVLKSVEKFNPDTNEWMNFPSMSEERRSHAVAVLNKKLYACGGDDKKSVEIYDPQTKKWHLKSSMNKQRYDFLVVPYKGKLWAIGGDFEYTVEVYDPRKDRWDLDPNLSSNLQMDFVGGGLIPSNLILNEANE